MKKLSNPGNIPLRRIQKLGLHQQDTEGTLSSERGIHGLTCGIHARALEYCLWGPVGASAPARQRALGL